jgi:hypothetical protein
MDQGRPPADVIKAMTDQNPGFTNDAAEVPGDRGEHFMPPTHRWSGIAAATATAAVGGPAILPMAGPTSCVVRP